MEGPSGLGAVAVRALGTLLQVTDQPQGGLDHGGLAFELVLGSGWNQGADIFPVSEHMVGDAMLGRHLSDRARFHPHLQLDLRST